MVAKDEASCFEAPPVVALVVGYFLTTGIVVSYIPQVAPLVIFLWINPIPMHFIIIILNITISALSKQIWMIIARRSSEGVSVLTMWLSFVCATLTFVNAFMLDWDGIQCCRYLVRSPPRTKASSTRLNRGCGVCLLQTVGQIFQQLLPLEQLFVGPFCLFFLYAHCARSVVCVCVADATTSVCLCTGSSASCTTLT